MKKFILVFSLSAACFVFGVFIGWWANSPGMDLLCTPSAVFELGKDIQGEGIYVKAGTQVNLRSCEYANRFSIDLYSEKGSYPELFIPVNSATNLGNHGADQYDVSIKEP